jgi:hypothetical protein
MLPGQVPDHILRSRLVALIDPTTTHLPSSDSPVKVSGSARLSLTNPLVGPFQEPCPAALQIARVGQPLRT